MDNSKKDDLINYPRFIADKPEGRDDYESKSQIKIANNIIQFLNENAQSRRRVIGIEGEWGSGKSNVIEILKNRLIEKYYFYIFDAWGHQEDLTRRSILEGLLDKLIKDEQLSGDKKKWTKELKNLLAKKVEREHKDIPKLSWGLILSFIGILLMPVTRFIAETYLKSCYVGPTSATSAVLPSKLDYVFATLILISPFIFLFFWILFKLCKAEKGNKGNVLSELFYVYKGKEITNTSEETISENEPSVRQFTEFLSKLEQNCPKKKIVIVFDNMDRLPSSKVIEIWSSIHTFFANDDCDLQTWAMVPFDDIHICNIFKDGYNGCNDGESKQRADSYIHKTFSIVFHIAPPVLSDWKYFFSSKFKEAFGFLPPYDQNLDTIFDFHNSNNPKIKPRDIICFVNDLVALKKLWNDEIPLKYLAIFALKRKEILINPFEKILKPKEVIGTAYSLFDNDTYLETYLSALAFNAPIEKADELLLKRTIEKALTGDGDLTLVSTSKSFFTIFDSAFYATKPNILHTIARLDELSEDVKNQPEMGNYWLSLSNNILEIDKPDKSHINAIKVLVKRLRDRSAIERVLKYAFKKACSFNDQQNKLYAGANYYNLITQIEGLLDEIKQDIAVQDLLYECNVEPEEFLDFVKSSEEKYNQFKVVCDNDKLNSFLTTKFVENVISEYYEGLRRLVGNTDFSVFASYIINIIPTLAASTTNLPVITKNIFEVGKILADKNQLPFEFTEPIVTSLLNALPNQECSLDLVLSIIKSNVIKPNPVHIKNPIFNKVLADPLNLEKFITNYVYYLKYNELIDYQLQFPNALIKNVINTLTSSSVQVFGQDVEKLISKYVEIKIKIFDNNVSQINLFTSKINAFYNRENQFFVFDENSLSYLIPFIQDNYGIDCSLVNDIINGANNALLNLDRDSWFESYKKWETSKIVGLFSTLISIDKYASPKLTQSANAAYLDVLIAISKKEIPVPSNLAFWNIMYRMHSGSLAFTFQTIRDELLKFSINNNISIAELQFFENGLFQYGKLNQNQFIADEALRLILIPLASNDEVYLNILKRNAKHLKEIINIAKEMIIDFKNTLDIKSPSTLESQECKTFTESLNDKCSLLIAEQHENRLIILKAKYGKNGLFNDVGNIITDLLMNNGSFCVENVTLGGDPIRNTVKELQIEYKLKKQTKTLIANEDEIIELHDDALIKKSTETSILKQTFLTNLNELTKIIKGNWYLKKSVGGEDLIEKIEIDNKGRFIIDNKHKFNLLVTEFNSSNIVLNKVNFDNDIEITEKLTLNSSTLISGTDNLGNVLEYSKK